MVTKEQCILEKVFDEIGYGRNPRLVQAVSSAYNQGKNYVSDGVFNNDERGLDTALQGFSPSFIVYSISSENSEYSTRDPFFVIDNGIRSFDAYDFKRMLKPEDVGRILNRDVLDELDDSDFSDAFDTFLYTNYPEIYKNFDYDMLDGYNAYDYQKANWDELAKSLTQQQVNEGKTLELTEEELRNMVAEGAKKVYEEIKIKEKNKGKFNATKARTGKSTEELTHSKNPVTRKRANFARMAKRGWEPLKKS